MNKLLSQTPIEFSTVCAVYKIKFLIYTSYINITTKRNSGQNLKCIQKGWGVFCIGNIFVVLITWPLN